MQLGVVFATAGVVASLAGTSPVQARLHAVAPATGSGTFTASVMTDEEARHADVGDQDVRGRCAGHGRQRQDGRRARDRDSAVQPLQGSASRAARTRPGGVVANPRLGAGRPRDAQGLPGGRIDGKLVVP